MCGRFTLTMSGDEVAEAFGLEEAPLLSPRYNIAPSQPVAAVRSLDTKAHRSLAFLRWGLVPIGSAEPRPHVNARVETAVRRPAFSAAFARRRCLIPADGFYEWQGPAGVRGRKPFYLQVGRGLFGMGGLWEPGPTPEAPATVTILTTEPNALVQTIHDRMPLIVSPTDYDCWLDPKTATAALRALLGPYPAARMTAHPVGPAVNNARRDDPSCILPPT
jgi:putative SOS response-associated peptidase YedK